MLHSKIRIPVLGKPHNSKIALLAKNTWHSKYRKALPATDLNEILKMAKTDFQMSIKLVDLDKYSQFYFII